MRTATAILFAMAAALPAAAQDASRAEAARKLGSLRISVDFKDATLAEAVGYLREVTGLNFMIRAGRVDADVPVRLKVKDLPVKSILRLLLLPRGLTAAWRGGVILIGPRGDVGEDVTLRLYDVRSFLVKLRDFPGPVIELKSGSEPEAGVYVLQVEEPKYIFEEEFIVAVVRATTGGRSWDSHPKASIDLVNGRLVVNQTPAVHREIRRLLARLARSM